MKPVYINFTDEEGKKTKTFTTCSLKTGAMDNLFELAEKAGKLEDGSMGVTEIRNFYQDLKSFILAIFSYQFSLEELNENVEANELMEVFYDIVGNIKGEMGKN